MSGIDKDLLAGALQWAENGVPVFPCGGNKRPLTKNGFKDAVTDPVKVRELFEFYGNRVRMVGARMGADAGMFAIDFDLYKELEAKTFMDDLAERGILPQTRIHRTMNGGIHLLYFSDGVFPNVNPVDGVEVKGEGGYIIVPPSPGYEVMHEGMLEAPSGLIEALLGAKRAQGEDTIDGLKSKILTASNFHDSLARLSAKLSGSGWSKEQVQAELMACLAASVASSSEHPRHSRWKKLIANSEDELSRIVGTGHNKFNSRAASDQLADAGDFDALRAAAERAGFFPPPQGGVTKETESVKEPEDYEGAWPFEGEGYFAEHDHDLLTQKFVMHPILCEDESVLIAAEPKTGKTALALTFGLHIACGLDLGPSLRVEEPRGVLYFGLEGRRAIRLRINAWRTCMAERGEDVPDRIPLFVVEASKNLLSEDARQNLANAIKAADIWMEQEHGISLGAIFIDTYTKAMPGGDQNSVEDTSSVFDVVQRVRATGCDAAVAFIHHKARAGHVRGSTNIEADPDVLTSVRKEGDRVIFSVDRARSVEEGGKYHFKLHNHLIGTSGQGFAIRAPFVEPVDAEDFELSDELGKAQGVSRAMKVVLGLGDGRHNIKDVYDALYAKDLAPISAVRRGTGKLRSDSKRVQEFFEELVPDTGYIFSGKAVEKIRNSDGAIIGIFIR